MIKSFKVLFEPHRDKTNKMACAPSEDSDQPGHPPSLIRVFAVRLKKARILSYPLSAQRRLWSDWSDAQADLSLRWAHMPFCWFCHDAAHLSISYYHKSNLIILVTFVICFIRLLHPNPVRFSGSTFWSAKAWSSWTLYMLVLHSRHCDYHVCNMLQRRSHTKCLNDHLKLTQLTIKLL